MAFIQTLHGREIDLSLERVRAVLAELCPVGIPFKVVTVAGTNGKGSTAEIIASILGSGGVLVGKYTSPHLELFNERFSINGTAVSDEALLASLKQVELARKQIPLTFFEFGTLVAIDLFLQAGIELAVMEVGLGGRLDAVNILEPEVCVITSIDVDHTAWLGDTLEQIATEKFGITRPHVPCILGSTDMPATVVARARANLVPILRIEEDFSADLDGAEQQGRESEQVTTPYWSFRAGEVLLTELPLPFGQSGVQLNNAAAAIAAVLQLRSTLNLSAAQVRTGIAAAQLAGRCQVWQRDPTIVIDVAHNVASVRRLAQFVHGLPSTGRVVAVCGMLKDKQIAESLRQMVDIVSVWHFCTLPEPRGSRAQDLGQIYQGLFSVQQANEARARHPIHLHATALEAFAQARAELTQDDCLIVFGSFLLSGDIIAHLKSAPASSI